MQPQYAAAMLTFGAVLREFVGRFVDGHDIFGLLPTGYG